MWAARRLSSIEICFGEQQKEAVESSLQPTGVLPILHAPSSTFLFKLCELTKGTLSFPLAFLEDKRRWFRSLRSKKEPILLIFESLCHTSIFNGMWDAKVVNVVLLCFGPFFPYSFCLDESWILGRCSCRRCVDKDICADPSSKQYFSSGNCSETAASWRYIVEVFEGPVPCMECFASVTYERTAEILRNYS